jgi:hypothetical protein
MSRKYWPQNEGYEVKASGRIELCLRIEIQHFYRVGRFVYWGEGIFASIQSRDKQPFL